MGLTKLWLRPDVDVGITMDMVSMTTVVVAVVVMESNLKQVETRRRTRGSVQASEGTRGPNGGTSSRAFPLRS